MSRKSYLFGCLIAARLVSQGCGRRTLEQPYDWSGRDFALPSQEEEGDRRASGFAEELCVISPDDVWDNGSVSAEAAGVFSLSDGRVVYGKNVFEQLYPASITKVMTAIVAIKYGNLADTVTVPQEAVITEPGATLSGIKPGDKLTLEQLLYGLMLPSGNDAGAAIAVHMAGSIEGFAEMMNQEAARLGATGTHFMNPHGLTDEHHYTTAYDLYLIFNEALKLPKFREVTGTIAYTANYSNEAGETVSREWKGGNWYLTGEREEPEGLTVFGGKTGTTQAAGFCLIMASRDEEENEYISVVLKAESRPKLYENMTEIIQKIVN